MVLKLKPVCIKLLPLKTSEINKYNGSSGLTTKLKPNQAKKSTQTVGLKVQDQSVQTAFEVVKALQDYIHYCCDQCDYKSKEGTDFQTHLDDSHEVKEDPSEDYLDDSHYDGFDQVYETVDEPIDSENKVEASSSEFSCLKCELSFDTDPKLIEHIKSNHELNDIWVVYDCKEYIHASCNFSCNDIADLQNHIKTHYKSKTADAEEIKAPFSVLTCLKCSDQKFDKDNQVQDIFNHIKNIHNEVEYACKDYIDASCTWTTTCDQLESFKAHIQGHFNEEMPLKKTKKSKKKLTKVSKVKKKKAETLIKCLKCDKSFNKVNNYLDHIDRHFQASEDEELKCNEYCQTPKDCQFSTKDKGLMVEHIQIHTRSRSKSRRRDHGKYQGLEFFCKDCKSDLPFTNGLALHLKGLNHTKQPEFKCNQHFKNSNIPDFACDKVFVTSVALIKHIRSDHVSSHLQTLTYKCDKCNKVFSNVTKLNRHVKHVHLGIAKDRPLHKNVCCEFCPKTFYSKSDLRFHQLAIHEKIKSNVCDICGKAFTKPTALTRHKKAVHDKEVTSQCTFCGQSFTWKRALQNHIEAKHSQGKSWQCESCPYIGSTKSNLKAHKDRMHETELKHICDFMNPETGQKCGAGFTAGDLLRVHKKKHNKTSKHYDPHIYPFPCPHCPKRFKRESGVLMHVRGIHAQISVHKCPVCDKIFNTQLSLQRHIPHQHPDFDKYFCHICDEKFFAARKLEMHINSAHDDTSVQCQVCSRVFKARNIAQHMSRTHGDDSYRRTPKLPRAELTESNSTECHICGKRIHLSSVSLHMTRIHKKSPKKVINF